jgi:tRNA(Ile)-lysidine synthetase-like protein
LRAEHFLDAFVDRLVALDDIDGSVVVGCSGGADSLALLALLRAAGHVVCAVYVDHGLRPDVHDHEVVAAAAARFGASFRPVTLEVDPSGSVEAGARDARYAALTEIAAELGAHVVAVGHTRDDQAETVLLNVLRGSAGSGLAGMPAQRGALRRPLLRFRRAETREICARLRLAPVHDAMNDDGRFRRVWLRREVIPRLERDARRDLVEVLARQADLLRDESDYLDALAGALLEPDATLDANRLASAPLVLARRAVRLWLGPPPPPLDQVQSVLDVARGASRATQLPNGRRVERVAGRLHLVPSASAPLAPTRLAVPGQAAFGPFTVDAWIEHGPPVSWPDGHRIAVFDADVVGPNVSVRSPESGDRFRPIGRSSMRPVHDALREAGIPAASRRAHPVVCTMRRDVAWVVGYRIDDRVKVTARTRRFLWMSVEPTLSPEFEHMSPPR